MMSGRVVGALVAVAMLFGLVVPFVSPPRASADIGRGAHSIGSNGANSDSVTIDSPRITDADVSSGAILIAQMIAASDASVSNISICPLESGWTQVTRVVDNSDIVQHIWWREVVAPQTESANYTFVSRADSACNAQFDVVTSMTGALTLYTGVDTDSPIAEVVSAASSVRATAATAPSTAAIHPAGSRVVRYFGADFNVDISSTQSVRLYSVPFLNSNRAVAAFDTVLSSDGHAESFPVVFSRLARWVATTIVLKEPGGSTEPTDTTAPTTVASSGPYVPDTWSNAAVSVNLSATDTGGSGVKEIVYSAAGDQIIGPTTVAGASASVTITNEGITTITYAATDNAGNLEASQTFVVKIDTTLPSLAGTASTLPNTNGWYRDDVTVIWACSDGRSGVIGGCPADSLITGEGDDLSASASVSDNAGNQTTASASGIRIDRTAPVTSIAPVPDWSASAVTVSFSASDNLSGPSATYYSVDDVAAQSGSAVTFDQSGVYSLMYWSVDAAGNVESPTTVEVKLDTNGPAIGHTLDPEPNVAGWHRSPVTITFECADGLSGIDSCSAAQTLETDGALQRVIGTAVDVAGNSATDTVSVNIDQSAPTVSASRTPDANAGGWNNTQVTVSFTCADDTSGIVLCPAAQVVGEGANQSVTGTATDLAGNAASATVGTINVDLTAPEIVATATTADGKPYVAGSWANQPVTVSFACSDLLSGIASCPASQTFTEGAGQQANETAIDVAGNQTTATFAGINIDTTAPEIVASLTMADGQPYTPGSWARQAVTIAFLCSDLLSDNGSCSAPRTLGDGANQSVTGTATDGAGNTASVTVGDIDVDTTGPTIFASALTADGQPYVSGVWTKQTVTVSFTCGDAGSGLAGQCPVPVVVSASTGPSGQSVAAQVSDVAGQTATSNAILVKVDTEAPRFTSVPGDIAVEATSAAGAVVSWDVPAATDTIGGAVIPLCTPDSGALFAIGTTSVTCTAADAAGNVASASFTVTVDDTQPPVLNAPAAITVPADGPSGAVVTYDVTASDSAAARVAMVATCTPPSGSRFRLGTTLVNCWATDANGNRATASFTVTVIGAQDLLATLRADTLVLVTNRVTQRALLKPLDQAQSALKKGNALWAYVSLLQYQLQIDWYARLGRISPAVAQQLQDEARQVLNALR